MALRLFVDNDKSHGDELFKVLNEFGLEAEVVAKSDNTKNREFVNAVKMDMLATADVPTLMVLDDEGNSLAYLENIQPGSDNHARIPQFLRDHKLIA